MVQIASGLENNHTGRKLPTMAIRLAFLFEIFLNIIIFLSFLSGFPYKSIFFVGQAHTELGAPVVVSIIIYLLKIFIHFFKRMQRTKRIIFRFSATDGIYCFPPLSGRYTMFVVFAPHSFI